MSAEPGFDSQITTEYPAIDLEPIHGICTTCGATQYFPAELASRFDPAKCPCCECGAVTVVRDLTYPTGPTKMISTMLHLSVPAGSDRLAELLALGWAPGATVKDQVQISKWVNKDVANQKQKQSFDEIILSVGLLLLLLPVFGAFLWVGAACIVFAFAMAPVPSSLVVAFILLPLILLGIDKYRYKRRHRVTHP